PPPGSLLSSLGRSGTRRAKQPARVPGGQIRRAVVEAARSGRSARWGSRRRRWRRAGRRPAGLAEAGEVQRVERLHRCVAILCEPSSLAMAATCKVFDKMLKKMFRAPKC
ncbi:unnamed protein product, partial [Urochloa humidicola]